MKVKTPIPGWAPLKVLTMAQSDYCSSREAPDADPLNLITAPEVNQSIGSRPAAPEVPTIHNYPTHKGVSCYSCNLCLVNSLFHQKSAVVIFC